MATLAHKLDRRARSGELYELKGFGSVRCTACALRCVIRPGRRGVCRVRFNDGGTLMVPWGYVVENSPLILDTRNVLKEFDAAHIHKL